eukprot:TRINITY_DN17430_c0_g1_i6.p1 TRINITY_DN17430_c0_g1~~TRINITY_DN17430_c0_g1_i6.p1  ORF type:complete len:108 (+),score=10.38 TRINITY_DN17430_c0_g1_i6:109-432(+)
MLRSLVGSEMCIRDRVGGCGGNDPMEEAPPPRVAPTVQRSSRVASGRVLGATTEGGEYGNGNRTLFRKTGTIAVTPTLTLTLTLTLSTSRLRSSLGAATLGFGEGEG